MQLFDGWFGSFEELLHHFVVSFGNRLDERLAPLRGLINEISGNLFDCVVLADLGLATPHECTHFDQIDDTDEVTFGTDRDLQYEGVRKKA